MDSATNHSSPVGPTMTTTTALSPEAARLQQHLYTLAFADRMRLLQPFSPFPHFLPPSFTPRFCLPPDLAMFPMAKLDPRLFRMNFPEEPKPQHSYIGLIAMAILSSAEKKLVLADIYQYILDNFPYFRHRGHGWRNSIRHNLSINDCFMKAGRASNGKGHYWAVHPACQEDFQKGDFSRRKAQRKVRRHMGLHMDEEEENTPPVSPMPSSSPIYTLSPIPTGSPGPLRSPDSSPGPSSYSPYLASSPYPGATPPCPMSSPGYQPASPPPTIFPAYPLGLGLASSFRIKAEPESYSSLQPGPLGDSRPKTKTFSFGIDSLLKKEEPSSKCDLKTLST